MAGKRGNGEGTVCLRADGRWTAVVTTGIGLDGKRKRKAFYGKTRKEVVLKMAQAIEDMKVGLVVDPKKISVGEFLTQWLEESVKQTVRCTTFENYSILVRVHIMPALGPIQLQKLTPIQIQRFLNQKLETGLSSRSVQYLLVLLRRALRLAVKWQMVQKNVALDVDPPKVTHKEVEPLTVEQAKQFLESIRGDRMEAVYVTTLALGLRRGEVLGLRWQDIDFEACTLSVKGSLQRVGGKLQILEPKTDKSKRTVVMPQLVVLALKAHKVRQLEHRLAMGSKFTDNGLVFANIFGDLYCPRRLNRQFDAAIKKAGLPKVRFHDLRHGAATMMMSQGVAIKTVSEVLGHSTTRMTLDVYSHVLDSMRQGAADKMDLVLNRVSLLSS